MISLIAGLLLRTAVSHLPDDVCLNADLQSVPAAWRVQAEKSGVKDPVVFCCHGGAEDGVWMVYPDRLPYIHVLPAEVAACSLRFLYPGREIVFFSCNEAAIPLHTHGLWYTTRLAWVKPGHSAVEERWVGGRQKWEVGTGSFKGFKKS